MTDADNHTISVQILDRHYQIKCPPHETSALQESAVYVHEQMKKAMQTNPASTDRIAVLTALNLCHELMQLKRQKNHYIDFFSQRIRDLQHRIENFLTTTDEIVV